MRQLNTKHIKFLRAQAHSKKPVITIGGNGVTPSLINETQLALDTHELIKVKLPALEKPGRQAMIEALCSATEADFIQLIGRVGVIYRASSPPRLTLP